MTNKEIELENMLIVDFMSIDEDVLTDDDYRLYMYNKYKYDDMDYDHDWNSLMPVVEKICKNYAYYQSNDSGEWQIMIDIANVNEVGANLLETVWLSVVKFIKWYNSNKL